MGNSYTCIFNYLLFLLNAHRAPVLNFKADELEHFVFLPSRKTPTKMNYLWPLTKFCQKWNVWFPSGTFATSWRRDKRWASPFPSSHTSSAVNTAAACVAEAGQKRGLSQPSVLFLHPGSQPPTFLKGDILSTSSLCQFHQHRKQTPGSPWGQLDPEASTQTRERSIQTVSQGLLRSPLPAIQHCTPWGPCFQSSETAVLATQFLIPLARGLIQNLLPLWDQASSFQGWGGACLQPSHSCQLAHCFPLSSQSPTREGEAGGLTNFLGSAQFPQRWPGSKESGLIFSAHPPSSFRAEHSRRLLN